MRYGRTRKTGSIGDVTTTRPSVNIHMAHTRQNCNYRMSSLLNSYSSSCIVIEQQLPYRCKWILGIVPELFLVLFRPGTTSVRSGLGTFFVPEPEHVIRRTKSWYVAHGGRRGVVRERVRTAYERRSVGVLTPDYRVLKTEPAPSTQHAGRPTVHPRYC